MRTLPFFMLLALLTIPVAVPARPLPPLEGLEAARRVFAGLNDFSADIVQEKQVSLLKKKMVSKGKVRFKRPDLFLLELQPPHAARLLMRDSAVVVETPGQERQKIPLSPDESLQRWLTWLAKPVTTLPEGVEVRGEEQGGIVTLTISPKKGQMQSFTVAFLQEGTLRRLTIEERNGNRTTITFRNMRKNSGLAARDFRLD